MPSRLAAHRFLRAVLAATALGTLAAAPTPSAAASTPSQVAASWHPARDRLQLVYAYPSNAVPSAERLAALIHDAHVVDDWYAGQMDGTSLRFELDPAGEIAVTAVRLPYTRAQLARRSDTAWKMLRTWERRGVIHRGAWPLIVIDGYQTYDACAWTWDGGRHPYISLPLDSCDAVPADDDTIVSTTPYLMAHEIGHALGAVDPHAPHGDESGHVSDDPGDIMFDGDWDAVDWDHLALDRDHDDYYRTGRTDISTIDDSPLLEPARS